MELDLMTGLADRTPGVAAEHHLAALRRSNGVGRVQDGEV